MLDKAGTSSSIELGAAEVLAIKAGLAIPWNKLRLQRWYVTTYSKGTISNSLVFQVAEIIQHGEERMCHISIQIVGDNLKKRDSPVFF